MTTWDFGEVKMAGRAIKDSELHAYVDGWLEPERRLEVEAYLVRDAEAAARVNAYRMQTEALHSLFDPVVAEDLPAPELTGLRDRLTARLAGNDNRRGGWLSSTWMRSAAAVVVLVSGVAGGWFLNEFERVGVARPPLQTFAEEAVQAHAFYTASRFAVEMGAEDPGALDTWLSQRLGRSIFGPDLTSVGYRLIGGRSLPTAHGAGVQYMYENDAQRRLTLFVSVPNGGQEAAFSYVQQGDISMFYWLEGSLAYALIGQVGRDDLMGIAQAVYRDFKTGAARRTTEQRLAPDAENPGGTPQGQRHQPAVRPVGDVKPEPM
ncbi:MAG TPA: anti-sigma factor [Arenibaculum sp.]|nr:anti-sigma factor [Arenibaculum sp.]